MFNVMYFTSELLKCPFHIYRNKSNDTVSSCAVMFLFFSISVISTLKDGNLKAGVVM